MPLNTNDLEYVMNELRIKLPGASDTGIKQALWGVIKKFLMDTNSWKESQSLLVTAAVQQYNIAPRDGGQIMRLVGVTDGNRCPVRAVMDEIGTLDVLTPITVTSLTPPAGTVGTSPNYPWTVFLMKNILLPGTKDNIPIAPAFVLSAYSQCVIDGVCANMMMEQAKTYTNVQMAAYHRKLYLDGITTALSDTWNQNLFGGERWTYPQQFATSSQRSGWAFPRGQ